MLSSFLSPLRLGVLLGLLLLLGWRRYPRWLRWLIGLPVLACIGMSLPIVANGLVGLQEERAPSAEACAVPVPNIIVVLSGGSSREPQDANDIAALSESSLRRQIGAVDLFLRTPSARMIISGGVSVYPVAESELMAGLAVRLGVPAADIRTEARSHSTWQNAQFVAALEPALPHRIWLVTSALHMPRSVYAFEQAGFEVCAWPVDARHARANSLGFFLPSIDALEKSHLALREFVGEAAYRMGWLRSLERDPWASRDER